VSTGRPSSISRVMLIVVKTVPVVANGASAY
jgi:hypothetical protein